MSQTRINKDAKYIILGVRSFIALKRKGKKEREKCIQRERKKLNIQEKDINKSERERLRKIER